MPRPNGVILYRGPSAFDGAPIVAVVTGLARVSKNAKTGRLLQTWIMADGADDPLTATRTGADRSVCGDCPHRPRRHGTCYVNLGQAPLAVWHAVQRGTYPTFHRGRHARYFRGHWLRMGSYGDPAMLPVASWRRVLRHCAGHTGYTHQWLLCDPAYRALLMASVETETDRDHARAAGWRTFRVRRGVESPVQAGEFICPASAEAGHRLTCQDCGACDGAHPGDQRATPVIVRHGRGSADATPALWRSGVRRFDALVQERMTALSLPVL